MALCKSELEESREAIAYATKAIKMSDGNSELLEERAFNYMRAEEWHKAIEDYETLIKLKEKVNKL